MLAVENTVKISGANILLGSRLVHGDKTVWQTPEGLAIDRAADGHSPLLEMCIGQLFLFPRAIFAGMGEYFAILPGDPMGRTVNLRRPGVVVKINIPGCPDQIIVMGVGIKKVIPQPKALPGTQKHLVDA